MSRRTKKRRAQRRERKAREALKPVSPRQPDTPVDWDRIQQRYLSMKGRAVTLRYVLFRPRVEAKTPEEFHANLAVALAQLAKGEPVN
jgi:hypothetical protein